ncbi:MAG TPA: ribulose-phosphate 3-epimerase [Dongiaceae bacterium]|jgi:ribulose-phosphate 3-epimerase|nr:ribulose-phosphate 3-epimerase [Dongiaceae bacterium]
MTKVAPSVLAADFTRLGEEVRAVERAGADYLHLDIMDGHFVPNLTFGPAMLSALRPLSALPFDVHLMISPVDPYIEAFCRSGADMITFHPEAGPHPHRTLQAIKAQGKKAGLALNPGTSLSTIEALVPLCDIILLMSVNPGFGGQAFLPEVLDKARRLRGMIDPARTELEIDGGINAATARMAREAGIDVMVAGTHVFGAPDYARAIAELRE